MTLRYSYLYKQKNTEMKYMILILTSVLVFSGASFAQGITAPKPSGAVMDFETLEVDYGSITQDSEPLRVFKFTNTGTAPLVIASATGSCGCTVPNYPKEPIMPGATSEIEVRYDTHRIGAFTKTVTLNTNAGNNSPDQTVGTFVLRIKGKVDQRAVNSTNPNAIVMHD